MGYYFGEVTTIRQFDYDLLLAGAKLLSIFLPLGLAQHNKVPSILRVCSYGLCLWRLWEFSDWAEQLWEMRVGGF